MAYKSRRGVLGNFKVLAVQGRDGIWTRRAYRLDAQGNYKSARPPTTLPKRFVAHVLALSAWDAISAVDARDQQNDESTSTGETNEQAPTGDTHVPQ